MDNGYIHPNFSPSDKDKYLELVEALRKYHSELVSKDGVIYVTKEEYQILEDAAHPSMKGKGHQVYGIEIKTQGCKNG